MDLPTPPEWTKKLNISLGLFIVIIAVVVWIVIQYLSLLSVEDNLTNKIKLLENRVEKISTKIDGDFEILTDRVDMRYKERGSKITTIWKKLQQAEDEREEIDKKVLVLETISKYEYNKYNYEK